MPTSARARSSEGADDDAPAVPVELAAGDPAADVGDDADVEGTVAADGGVLADVAGGAVGVATWPGAVPVVLDAAW